MLKKWDLLSSGRASFFFRIIPAHKVINRSIVHALFERFADFRSLKINWKSKCNFSKPSWGTFMTHKLWAIVYRLLIFLESKDRLRFLIIITYRLPGLKRSLTIYKKVLNRHPALVDFDFTHIWFSVSNSCNIL